MHWNDPGCTFAEHWQTAGTSWYQPTKLSARSRNSAVAPNRSTMQIKGVAICCITATCQSRKPQTAVFCGAGIEQSPPHQVSQRKVGDPQFAIFRTNNKIAPIAPYCTRECWPAGRMAAHVSWWEQLRVTVELQVLASKTLPLSQGGCPNTTSFFGSYTVAFTPCFEQ